MHYIQAMRIPMQVVELCPTPHKLFEKSLSQILQNKVFAPRSTISGLAETPRALAAPKSRRGQREPGNICPGKAGQTFPWSAGRGRSCPSPLPSLEKKVPPQGRVF
jgi:hypothetical protein